MVGKRVKIEPIVYTLVDDNNHWKYAEGESYDGMHVVMGNVAYRVSDSALGEITPYQRKVIHSPFYVFANIGEINVTASREGLDYNNRTKTHVRKYINDIISTFNAKVQIDINQCSNLWEARKTYIEIEKENKSGLLDPSKITYNGVVLFEKGLNAISLTDMIDSGEIEVISFAYCDYKNPEKKKVNSIKPSSSLLLYTNDLKIGAFVRANHLCKKQEKSVLIVSFKQPVEQKFYDRLGLDSSYFALISTIPSPTIRVGYKRGKLTQVVKYVYNDYIYNPSTSYWCDAEVNLKNDNGIYVEFNRYRVKDHNGYMAHPGAISSILSMLSTLDIDIPVIYGIKSSQIQKVVNKSRWINFYSWVKEKVEAELKTIDVNSVIEARLREKNVFSSHSSRFKYDVLKKIKSFCGTINPFTEFVESVDKQHVSDSLYDKASNLSSLCRICKIIVPKSKMIIIDLKKLENEVYRQYPLLSMIECEVSSYCYSSIAKYIDLMS
jgi:hypothetical protein